MFLSQIFIIFLLLSCYINLTFFAAVIVMVNRFGLFPLLAIFITSTINVNHPSVSVVVCIVYKFLLSELWLVLLLQW